MAKKKSKKAKKVKKVKKTKKAKKTQTKKTKKKKLAKKRKGGKSLVYLGIGSNVGDREEYIEQAVRQCSRVGF